MDRHLHLRPHCAHILSPCALAHRLPLLTLTFPLRTRPSLSLHIFHLLSALAIHLRRQFSLHSAQCPILRVHHSRAHFHREPLNFRHITAFAIVIHETAHCPPHRLGHSPRIGPFDHRHLCPIAPFRDLTFRPHNAVRTIDGRRVCDAAFADGESRFFIFKWRGASARSRRLKHVALHRCAFDGADACALCRDRSAE